MEAISRGQTPERRFFCIPAIKLLADSVAQVLLYVPTYTHTHQCTRACTHGLFRFYSKSHTLAALL